MQRQRRDPGAARAPVAQVVTGRARIGQAGDRAQAIIGRQQQVRPCPFGQPEDRDGLRRICQRRRPDKTEGTVAEEVDHPRGRYLIDEGNVADRRTFDQPVAGRVDPVADFTTPQVQEVGKPVAVQVDDQQSIGVEFPRSCEIGSIVHGNRASEAAVSQMRPELDAAVADTHLVRAAITRHVGEAQAKPSVFHPGRREPRLF